MASIAGSQFVFSAPQPLNLTPTTDGSGLPPPIGGSFNLELITAPSGNNFPIPRGYQGVALLDNATTLTMLHGNYEVSDTDSDGRDTIIGGDGFDTVNVLVGNDLVILGSGNSTVFGAAGDTIEANGGGPRVTFTAGFSPITVSSVGGQITVRSGAEDTLTGGSVSTTFIGACGDRITTGPGSDRVNATANSEAITLGTGHALVNVFGSNDTINPVAGNDTINLVQGGTVANNAFEPTWNAAGIGDFAGSGVSGIVWDRPSDGIVEIQFLQGNNVTGGGTILDNAFDQTFQVVAVGDFNGDGKSDLAYRRTSDGVPEIQLLNGAASTGGGILVNNTFDTSFKVIGTGDFTGDGHSDLLWQRPSDGLVEIQFIDQNGTAVIGGGQIINNAFTNTDFRVVGVGDFNGDGKSDLVWQRPSDGLVEVQLLDGLTVLGGGQIANNAFTNTDFRVVSVGDFNGDGKSDLVWQRPSDGLIEVQFLNGNTAIGGGVVANPLGPDWKVVGAGDFTGSGNMNGLVLRNQTTGGLAIQSLDGITPIGGNSTIVDGAGTYFDTVVGFVENSDTIKLASGETPESVLATSHLVNGGQDTQITLASGSTIVFKGITHVDTGFFS
jgi:hypothetical protein